MTEKYDALLDAARAARENAYAPYSGYRVGAAILSADGEIFCGANVENAAYPAGICAERAALSAAVTAGKRKFTALALWGEAGITPCGLCRQALAEFSDMWVIAAADGQPPKSYTLSRLLPESFSKGNLKPTVKE
jgi:cytidine deaminase